MAFENRVQAGRALASLLKQYKDQPAAVVFALPRGGVVVGAEVAKELNLPLDLVIPRKIGHPLAPEYAIAAVAENGHLVTNPQEIASVDKEWFDMAVKKEQEEAKRRKEKYLGGRKHISPEGKVAIIIDDGVATGLTMKAAVEEIKHPAKGPRLRRRAGEAPQRRQKAKKIVVAVPVIPKEVALELRSQGVEVVAVEEADPFLGAIGAYYQSFPQVSDDEVIELLNSKCLPKAV